MKFLPQIRRLMTYKGKGKVVPVFKHHAMKGYWGSGDMAPRILDFGTRWGEWSASRPSRFSPRQRASGTHWIGDCGPQNRSGRGCEERSPRPLPGHEPPM